MLADNSPPSGTGFATPSLTFFAMSELRGYMVNAKRFGRGNMPRPARHPTNGVQNQDIRSG